MTDSQENKKKAFDFIFSKKCKTESKENKKKGGSEYRTEVEGKRGRETLISNSLYFIFLFLVTKQ